MSSFHPLEVVGRGSETQFQMGEKIKRLTLPDNLLEINPLNTIVYVYTVIT